LMGRAGKICENGASGPRSRWHAASSSLRTRCFGMSPRGEIAFPRRLLYDKTILRCQCAWRDGLPPPLSGNRESLVLPTARRDADRRVRPPQRR
jgi:hypothetical protein